MAAGNVAEDTAHKAFDTPAQGSAGKADSGRACTPVAADRKQNSDGHLAKVLQEADGRWQPVRWVDHRQALPLG